MSEAENRRRWDDATQGVYEVWYLTWNHPATDQGFWLRYLIEAPVHGAPRAELWFARFDPGRPERTFGIHKQFSLTALASHPEPFGLEIATSRLAHDRAIGELAGDGHEVRWQLRWDPADSVLRQLPDVMYARGGLGETTVQSPNPRVEMSGTLWIDGEELVFDRAVLGQTHVWGKKHAYAWTWGRCADSAGAPDAVLEVLGVRLQRRGMRLPPMTLVVLDLDGEHHRLNQFRHVVGNRSSWGDGRVRLAARSPLLRIEGELTCRPSDMVSAPYVDPDGTELFCANTEIGDARLTIWKRAGLGWRQHRTLEGKRRAHFEIGGRTRDPAVVREHVLIE